MSKKNSKAAGRVGGVADGAAAVSPKTRKAGPTTTTNELTTANNVVDFPAASGVSSNQTETVNPVTEGENTMTLNLITKAHKGSSIRYTIGQSRMTVKFPRSAFAAAPPATIEVPTDGFVTPAPAKAKMSKEERQAAQVAEKARVASLTPEQRQAEVVAKAEARRKKLQDQLARVNARLNPVTEQPAAEQETVNA